MLADEIVTLTAATPVLLTRGSGLRDTAKIVIVISGGVIFIGGSAVSNVNGIEVPAFEEIRMTLPAGENLYGYSVAGGSAQVLVTNAGSPTEVGN